MKVDAERTVDFGVQPPSHEALRAAVAAARLPPIHPPLFKPPRNATLHRFEDSVELVSDLRVRVELLAGEQAVAAKAADLTPRGLPGAPTSGYRFLGQGRYMRRYEGADIYYSPLTGAHEVHGDIRAKYNAIGGPFGALGLPKTDELNTLRGKFNDFEFGSIYWTPDTGPMAVLGANRDQWLTQFGELGYPVADQSGTLASPEQRALFENGGVFSKGPVAARALVARVTPQRLACFVRAGLDALFQGMDSTLQVGLLSADLDLGIEGPIGVLHVSDWGYGFWTSEPRRVTYDIHGFNSTGTPGPDPTFRLEMTLEFALLRLQPEEPAAKMVTMALKRLGIHTSGIGHDLLADLIGGGFREAPGGPFVPRRIPQAIPAEARVMGLVTTPQGGLDFLVEPSIPDPASGVARRDMVQAALDTVFPAC